MKRYLLISILTLCAATAAAQPRLSFHKSVALESEEITSLAFSGDEQYLAVGTAEGNVFILDAEDGSVLKELTFHRKEVSSLIFDSRDAILISGSRDKDIVFWDFQSGARQHVIEETGLAVTGLALSPDDRILAACGNKKDLYCWDFPSGHFRGKLKGHKKDAIFVGFNKLGDQLLSVGKDRKMIFWDIASQQSQRVSEIAVQTMNNSGVDVTAATCSGDRQVVAVAVQEHALDKGGRGMKFERSIAYYDWATGSQLKVITGNQKEMNAIRLTPQSAYVISDNSSLHEFQLSFWDAEAGVVVANHRFDNSISCFELSGSGRWLVSSFTGTKAPPESYVNLWSTSGIGGSAESDWSPDILRNVITLNDSLPLIQSGPPRPLAVLYFGYNNVEESVARSATIMLENRLFKSPYVRLLERNQIDKILSELDLQQSGLTVSKAIEIGKLIEAELIILGSVDKLDNELHITARLVDVNSGQIVGIREISCTNASAMNIIDMTDRLAPAIAKMN